MRRKEENERQTAAHARRRVDAAGRMGNTAMSALQVPDSESREEENVGVEAARKGEEAAERISRSASSAFQKRRIRREYAAAKVGRASETVSAQAFRQAQDAAGKAEKAVGRAAKSGKGKLALVAVGLMLLYVLNTFSACTPIVQAVLQALVIGSYPAEEADVMEAELAYRQMEANLQAELNNYVFFHPEYDEAVIEQMELWHDPYALIALVSAMIGNEWTIDTAYPALERIFAAQYEVTTSAHTAMLPGESGEEIPVSTVKVTVKNNILSHLPCLMLSHEQLGMYALYMASLGNMPELFMGWPHASQMEEPLLYDVPQAALDADPRFARLMEEAVKYIGYPYVWGGGDPSTSFDCSGFLSWIFTQTGVANVGRLGATGLYGACRPVSEDEARPGDVVFFTGTLGEGIDGNGGITHCGLYVGEHMMIHCGNPLSFADLSRPYWQAHFYGYGRLYE